jgi:hypothetical protein
MANDSSLVSIVDFQLERQLELLRKIEFWKNAALYLMDIHAANAHDGCLKSCSKSKRKRYRAICQNCLNLLDGYPHRAEVAEKVRERLEDAISSLPEE